MAFNLESISSGTRLRAPRIILLGVEKIGKSTFAASANSAVVIPIKGEEGIDAIDVKQFPTCNTLSEVIECVNALYHGEHPHEAVVIDSGSALEPLVWADVCERHGNVDSIEKVMGGYGKGFTEATTTWRQLTGALDALRSKKNMASIIIGHVKVKRFDDPITGSYDTYQFDIHDKAANLLYRWADAILFANTKVVIKSEDIGFDKETKRGIDIAENQRFLYTQKRPSHPGGGRGAFGQLPYELPLSWQAWMDAVSRVGA